MESIINFFEQYWGLTIFGGVTVGTLITFIVVQLKTLVSSKFKDTQLDTACNKITELCTELNKRDKENQTLQEQLIESQQYFNQVQATLFQAVSYIVVASKLPIEDKLALQEKFTQLAQNKKIEYTEVVKEDIESLKNKVANIIIPDVKEAITETVAETKSLLDKYMEEE